MEMQQRLQQLRTYSRKWYMKMVYENIHSGVCQSMRIVTELFATVGQQCRWPHTAVWTVARDSRTPSGWPRATRAAPVVIRVESYRNIYHLGWLHAYALKEHILRVAACLRYFSAVCRLSPLIYVLFKCSVSALPIGTCPLSNQTQNFLVHALTAIGHVP